MDKLVLEGILAKLNPDEIIAINDMIKLADLAEIDPLTEVYNRRRLDRDVKLATARANRVNSNFSFLMIDIDNFKRYNDEHGHPEGDKKLKKVAEYLKESLREHEQEGIYRYGGEEFAIIMPDTNIIEGRTIGERLRKNIENNCDITISIGLSNYKMSCNNITDLINFADRALYDAKGKGRNMVRVYQGV